MNQNREALKNKVFAAARDQGISSVLFRNAVRKRLGLTITDSECLSYLGIKGEATPTELARYSGLTTGSVTAMLDRLERAGFITRSPHPTDRRGSIISLNLAYQEAAGPLVAGVQIAHKQLLDKYDEAQLEAIADFLIGFTKNVEASTDVLNKN